MHQFFDWCKGVILGIIIGVSLTNIYFKLKGLKYKSSEVIEIVKDTNTLSCALGAAETVRMVLENNEKGPNCIAVGEKWAEIYKD